MYNKPVASRANQPNLSIRKEPPDMHEQWPINGYFNPTTMEGLHKVIASRTSCRRFQNTPFADEWNDLEQAAQSLVLPGTRLVLGTCGNDLFRPFGGLLIKFENARHYAAVIVANDSPRSLIHSGVCGEMLMLYAVQCGIGGCWVAGTYKRGQVGLALDKGEGIAALIALGVPQSPIKPLLVRKRKPIERIVSANFTAAPPVFQTIALAVQAAPSAMNLQPWRLAFEPDHTMTLTINGPRYRLDLGIALCHAMLAIGGAPARYELSADALSVRIIL